MKNIPIKNLTSYRFKAFLLACGLTFTACNEEELLNPVPDTSIVDKNAYDTPARVLGLVNGIYDAVKSSNFYGGRYVMYGDFRGEEFLNRTQNIFTGYDTWSHTLNSGSNDASVVWEAAYTTINLSNVFLQGLQDNAAKVDPTLAEQYAGEAKFLRALSYFSLITLYAKPYVADQGASPGLPLRLQAETNTANNNLARSSVAEIYAQILKDLNEAEAALPLTYTTALLNTTRAHKNTAIALKTRVYLNQGNYQKVIEEGDKIILDAGPYKANSGVQHQLQASVADIFSSNYTTTESIFSMPMTDLDSSTGQGSLGYIYNVNAEYNLNPAGIMGNTEWRATDSRRTFLRTASGLTYLRKYGKPSPFLDYVPVIRYAEVLLNYAEAAAKTGNLPKAVELLNAVRKRSDATYTFPASAIGTPDALVNIILTERRIELLGEGFRSNDLLRNLMTIPAKGSSSLLSPAVMPSEEAYIFPLPNSEISTNKLL